jgi:hypothetical protein
LRLEIEVLSAVSGLAQLFIPIPHSQGRHLLERAWELDDMTNMSGRDDIPNSETTDVIQEKAASDLESGLFNPSIDTASIRPPSEERENNIIDWDGPEDPENPLNWPRRKRVSHVALVSIITFIS